MSLVNWLSDVRDDIEWAAAVRARRREKANAMHPRRARVHETTTGERLADQAAGLIGSWRFLIVQACLLAAWVLVNAIRLAGFDPPPFILLNLCLSFQAAFTGPVLLIAANRAAQRDRKRDDAEAAEVDTSAAILAEMRQLVADLHTHTTCAGHTTIGQTAERLTAVYPVVPAKPAPRKRAAKSAPTGQAS